MTQKDYTTNSEAASEFKFEKTEEIAILDRNRNGWTTELNKVSYNGGNPRFDLRSWSPEGKMGKGLVLRDDVAFNLFMALADYFEEKSLNDAHSPEEATYPEDFHEVPIKDSKGE